MKMTTLAYFISVNWLIFHHKALGGRELFCCVIALAVSGNRQNLESWTLDLSDLNNDRLENESECIEGDLHSHIIGT